MPLSVRQTHSRLAAALGLLIVATAAATGCGDSGPEKARVTGTVTVNGKPLTRGTVTFVSTVPERPNATSQIGADGSYDLQTTADHDGAVLGEYKVTVSDIDTSQILDYIPKKGSPKAQPKSMIPEKYASPDTSGLTKKVERGSNKFNIDIEG